MTQITLSSMISEGAELTEEQKESLYLLVAGYCHQDTKRRLRSKMNVPMSCWANYGQFDRVHLESDGKFRYCAGQSYPDEIRALRKLILG